ncbi:MAG: NADP-dependent 3-hydroxy acid dehydrogenase YdfG [Natronomonas sp.]
MIDDEQAQAVIDASVADRGGLDIIVNSAGVMLLETVADADTDNLRRMVEGNLVAVMNATTPGLPIMREQGRGHVVTVPSVAGRQTSASGNNATKFGVNGSPPLARSPGMISRRAFGLR